MNFTDRERLLLARELAIKEVSANRIGTLGEKLIHKTIKYYISENEENHEKKLKGAVADVARGGEIFEIQTRSLSRLVPKLMRLLGEYSVTVVYPLVTERSIVWLSPESGEASEPKKTSKKQIAPSSLYELSSLFELLDEEGLTVEILLLRATEYRLSDGYGNLGHKRATKLNIQPDEIYEQITLKSRSDISKLLPTALPSDFTAKDLYKALKLRDRQGFYALKSLEKYGFLASVGKAGRATVYKLVNINERE